MQRVSAAALLMAVLAAAASAASAPATPKVSIKTPAAGAVLAGTVVLSARAASPAGISGVQFQLDGADLGARLTAAPYAFSWDTTQSANAAHRLTAVAWDNSGNSAASAAVPVAVDNAPVLISEVSAVDATENAATIVWKTKRPADSQVEYGPTTAYSSSTILDGEMTAAHSAPLSGLTPVTVYHYRVKSKSASGIAAASSDFTFTTVALLVDTAPPTVVIMNPPSGAFVSSTVIVTANAADNAGVAGVQFLLDGVELNAPVTSAPYLLAWNTMFVADGVHVLGAIARDAAGNSATSVVSVTVINTPPVIGTPSLGAAAPNSVDILWTTDQRSDSAVSYGPTAAYGYATPTVSALSTGHGAALTGLASGTQYHYQVRSRNAAGVLAVSGDFTFATPGASTGTALGAAGAGPAATDLSSAKAPQKFLTPATADGVNDDAVFGPGAQEVWIYDVRGKQIYHGTSTGPGFPVVWNCRDGSGRIVPSGVYIAKILTRDSQLQYQSFAVAK